MRDQPGWGAEVPCTYRLAVRTAQLRQAMALFDGHLTRAKLETFVLKKH